MTAPDRDKITKALDALDLDSLDDFDSEDFDEDDSAQDSDTADARGRNAYVSGLWSRYGMSEVAGSQEDKIIQAHKMVQGFVDTFATDGRYRVTFDPGISTAGTDLIGHRIVITPAPLFDANLPAERAAVILTAMATHEICHPRYGRSTAAAVRRVFGARRAPNTLSNLLDDVRIERRFAADYPGYADVFRPMLEYIALAVDSKSGEVRPQMTDLVNLSIMAIRYPSWTKWESDEVRAERDWWQAWAERWVAEDAPRRHVEAVREGLKRIVAVQRVRAKIKPRPQPQPGSELARISKGLSGLEPTARKAMRLSSEGRTGLQIAATLAITEEQVKRSLREARKYLAAVQ